MYMKSILLFKNKVSLEKIWGFPGGSVVKIASAKQETQVQSWVRKIPWKRKWQPTSVFWPGKSHGQRSLVGYSPWGCKESDIAEQITAATVSQTL